MNWTVPDDAQRRRRTLGAKLRKSAQQKFESLLASEPAAVDKRGVWRRRPLERAVGHRDRQRDELRSDVFKFQHLLHPTSASEDAAHTAGPRANQSVSRP